MLSACGLPRAPCSGPELHPQWGSHRGWTHVLQGLSGAPPVPELSSRLPWTRPSAAGAGFQPSLFLRQWPELPCAPACPVLGLSSAQTEQDSGNTLTRCEALRPWASGHVRSLASEGIEKSAQLSSGARPVVLRHSGACLSQAEVSIRGPPPSALELAVLLGLPPVCLHHCPALLFTASLCRSPSPCMPCAVAGVCCPGRGQSPGWGLDCPWCAQSWGDGGLAQPSSADAQSTWEEDRPTTALPL